MLCLGIALWAGRQKQEFPVLLHLWKSPLQGHTELLQASRYIKLASDSLCQQPVSENS